jgi:pyruvate kinase
MNRINLESEFLYNYKKSNKHYNKKDLYSQEIMKTVNLLHKKSQPKGEGREIKFPLDFIVISTNDEKLIQAISNGRLGCNVIVITNSKEIYTQYGVYYGILPYFSNEIGEEGFKKAVNLYSKGEKKVKALLYKDGEFSKV